MRMLESKGLQTRPLQKIQMPGDNKPTPTDNKQIPVAKELVRSSPAKICQLNSKKRVRILAS